MTIQTNTSRVSFNTNGSSTVFPIPIQAYLATDFLVLLTNTVTGAATPLVLNSDYTLVTSGTQSPTQWSLTTLTGQFSSPYAAGYTLQIILNPTNTQLTQYVQGQAFPSLALQTNVDRLTQEIIRRADINARCIRAPDGDLSPAMLLPTAVQRALSNLTFDALGNISTSKVLASGTLSRSTIGGYLYPILGTEVGVTDTSYPYGYFRRFGAQGLGYAHDDTLACQNCLNSSVNVYGTPGDIYGVTQIIFPSNALFTLFDGNGSGFVGIASTPTGGPIVLWQCSSATIIRNYYVAGVGNGTTIASPNPNYVCATQWYNASSGSQFITVDRVLHLCHNRGFVYGALPGNTPTGGPQSENTISGLQNIGVANPFYSNAMSGFVYLVAPILNVNATTWTSTFPTTTPRALEIISGFVEVLGGELEYATQATGYAADLQSCTLIGVNLETAAPIQIIGGGVQITHGQLYNTQSNQPAFKIASGLTGELTLTGPLLIERGAGLGATAMVAMIDSTAAPNFNIVLTGTSSTEWPWNMQGQDIRLVAGGKPVYHNHRMNITAADPNVFNINTTPFDSLLPQSFDHLGYTTTGWKLTTDSGGGTTMTATTIAGPTGYLAAQITLHATGTAVATNMDTTNLASIQSSALHVRPGELYWVEGQFDTTAGTAGSVVARGFNLAGTLVGDTTVADPVAVGTGAWKFISAPLVIPATVAYIGIGVKGSLSDIAVTNLRIRRA